MEVHHHPDLHHNRKKFREYFLEFLMIFLAVTMGFLAESYHEYLNDRSKEKIYIKSLIEDLKTDSSFLELSLNKLIPYHLTWLDSTVHLLQLKDIRGKERQIYQAFMIGTGWSYNFHPTERTLTQLHSEGFHVIKNKEAVSSISKLETQYKNQAQITTYVENMQNDIDLSAYSFADRSVTDKIATTAFKYFSDSSSVNLQLSDIPESATIDTSDKEAIKLYVEKLKKYSFYLQYQIKLSTMISIKEITTSISVLNKEYNIE